MTRQAVEQLDQAESIHLSYVVAGSGGAGVTVMRTTFYATWRQVLYLGRPQDRTGFSTWGDPKTAVALELQHSFDAWIDGQWQRVKPYSDSLRDASRTRNRRISCPLWSGWGLLVPNH
ncbi:MULTISPECIES: hypothetical protein [Planktothricoides]|uniref:Uncharacterized protein n=1 Tax=Planktothricoides raciborskii GIHE-MW2 TaxID=2792601 RepID=A0AAU8JDH3_9CYAN|nr:hypothetical protein [Planktothricoides raciborskii]